MSAFDSSEEDGYCGSCNILLDHFRDGTTENGHRCNNCYWEEEEGPSKIISPDYRNINQNKKIKLCKNEDCTEKPTDESEKCQLCDGYFIDDGLNDIYFLEENGESGSCSLCGKTENICIMKGSGQEICINACDEDSDSEDES
jgi:hypothetical protein